MSWKISRETERRCSGGLQNIGSLGISSWVNESRGKMAQSCKFWWLKNDKQKLKSYDTHKNRRRRIDEGKSEANVVAAQVGVPFKTKLIDSRKQTTSLRRQRRKIKMKLYKRSINIAFAVFWRVINKSQSSFAFSTPPKKWERREKWTSVGLKKKVRHARLIVRAEMKLRDFNWMFCDDSVDFVASLVGLAGLIYSDFNQKSI